jgi:multidrug efflux pump subunit AcrB
MHTPDQIGTSALPGAASWTAVTEAAVHRTRPVVLTAAATTNWLLDLKT